jgi:hypothetical protein
VEQVKSEWGVHGRTCHYTVKPAQSVQTATVKLSHQIWI